MEEDEDEDEDGLSLLWLLLLLLLLWAVAPELELELAGGRVRDERTLAGSGGHSLPSRAGGGPVRRLGSELFLLLPLLLFCAHLGTRALLLSRWAIIWCIHSTSG